MGTSSSYGGPKGKNPLLPDDFQSDSSDASDNAPDDNGNSSDQDKSKKNDNDKLKPKLWTNVKNQVSRLVANPSNDFKKPLSSYVNAHGGSQGATASAKAGKKTTAKLANFISLTKNHGFTKTLTQYSIQYENRSAHDVLSELVNKLAPAPNTKEEAVARNALLDTLDFLYLEIEKSNGDIESLDHMDLNMFDNLINTYISAYIFQRFLSELESRFENNSSNENSAFELEEIIKDYICGVVDNVAKKYTFSSTDIHQVIDDVYTDCYEVIVGVVS